MKVGRGLLLMVLILSAAGPLYLLLKVSVSPPAEVMTPHPLLLPHAVTWRFWQRVLASGQITAPLWKSLGVASGVALLALTLAGPAAYSLAQLPVHGAMASSSVSCSVACSRKSVWRCRSLSSFCAGAYLIRPLASFSPI
jgi:ABC-type glycerol-3-phosphate transport system permease component